MNIIDKIRKEEREELARVLKKHSGIRKMVEDLYPDNAHFIYELLQNAEDTEASEVKFVLYKDKLIFEHNGRPFDEKDIMAITDIGEGTKAEDEKKIGQFGIGFKAVFSYSETPHIWSPTFSFKIADLVLPYKLDGINSNKTVFEFPFNNPKKNKETAFKEIKQGLDELEEITLLFLENINLLIWEIHSEYSGEVIKIIHPEYHIEILKKINGKIKNSSHFLKFDRPAEGIGKQKVAIAFPLAFIGGGVKEFKTNMALSEQMKIVPDKNANVSVYFPAKKEISGLRFHLHAPFIPELSRASIKSTPANNPLFEQIADLTALSLNNIKTLGLLNTEFLNVLPNNNDTLHDTYEAIRKKVINEMNNEPLTPTFCRDNYPAKYLIQGDRKLKDLLSNDDIKFLYDYDEQPPMWVMSSRQKNDNADRFLNSLQIKKWDKEELIKKLYDQFCSDKTDEYAQKWLYRKSIAWLQNFYALLCDILEELDSEYIYQHKKWTGQLSNAKLIRLTDGSFNTGENSYFYNEERREVSYPTVEPKIYSSGKNQDKQNKAKTLLEKLGVREFSDKEYIKYILNERYQDSNYGKKNIKDTKLFIDFLEEYPNERNIFENYSICLSETSMPEKSIWCNPKHVYIDRPYEATNLNAFYSAFEDHGLYKISREYLNLKIEKGKLINFFKNIGIRYDLKIQEIIIDPSRHIGSELKMQDSPGNQFSYLRNYLDFQDEAYRINRRIKQHFRDCYINGLDKALQKKDIGVSRLIWNILKKNQHSFLSHSTGFKETNYSVAMYRPNSTASIRTKDSILIKTLKSFEWIPQQREGEDLVFVTPDDAASSLLPEGFSFDKGYGFLKAIHFSFNSKEENVPPEEEPELEEKEQINQKEIEEENAAKALGFKNLESAKRAKAFSELPEEEQERLMAEAKQKQSAPELPDNESPDPDRRGQEVYYQAISAPEKRTEKKIRTVSINRDDTKKESRIYLINQYTNMDGIMICQICQKELPFKLKNGDYYFEAAEFLKEYTDKIHYQNFLALCPNHSAMFCHANDSESSMLEAFKEIQGNLLEVALAGKDMKIYFTKKHIADIKAIIEAESEKRE